MMSYGQSKDKTEALLIDELLGIWMVADDERPEESAAVWEFTADGLFYELKAIADGDATLKADEHGYWLLEQDQLELVLTGEEMRGKQITFEEPKRIIFEAMKRDSLVILKIIELPAATASEIKRLRLIKK